MAHAMLMAPGWAALSCSRSVAPACSPSRLFNHKAQRRTRLPIVTATGGESFSSVKSMESSATVEELKAALLASLEGLNRGIFGVQNAKKAEIESLLQSLEQRTPSPRPTDDLHKVDGEWKLLYSTISILGSKRTKLGLRDFISLGDFVQAIDVDQGKAVNKVIFSVSGLGMLSGSFTIEASYTIVSPTRVEIKFENSTLVPEQLLSLFQKNYDMLLSIFNPEGWLEITYVDEVLRIGRDDKGNVFLLERMHSS